MNCLCLHFSRFFFLVFTFTYRQKFICLCTFEANNVEKLCWKLNAKSRAKEEKKRRFFYYLLTRVCTHSFVMCECQIWQFNDKDIDSKRKSAQMTVVCDGDTGDTWCARGGNRNHLAAFECGFCCIKTVAIGRISKHRMTFSTVLCFSMCVRRVHSY